MMASPRRKFDLSLPKSKRNLFLFILAVAGLISLLLSLVAEFTVLKEKIKDDVVIALVAPRTGNDRYVGDMIVKSAQVFTDQITRQGGVNGHRLVVRQWDEGGTPEAAVTIAKEIVESGAIAVIGHWSKEQASAAADIYRSKGVPFLSLAKNDGTVSDGRYHLISDDTREVLFLANYLRNILDEKTIGIMHVASERSRNLAETFDKGLQRFGSKVVYRWEVDADKSGWQGQLEALANEVKGKMAIGTVLLLADDAATSASLLAALRKAGVQNRIAGMREMATRAFRMQVTDQWQGAGSAQALANGVVTTTPLLFDTSNETVQSFRSTFIERQGEAPDWVAALTNDALRMITAGLHYPDVTPWSHLEDLRTRLSDWLGTLDRPGKTYPSMTGPRYFDSLRRTSSSMVMGQYDGLELVSGMVQLLPIRDEGVVHYLKEVMAGRALYVNDRFMYRTNVVFTGVTLLKIYDLNVADNSATLEAQVWFRWMGDLEPQDIIFPNALEPIRMENPERQGEEGPMHYRLYRIKGKFLLNYSSAPRFYGSVQVGLSFRHRFLGWNNLLYVTDVIGMNLTGKNRMEAMLGSGEGLMQKRVPFLEEIAHFLSLSGEGIDPLTAMLKQNRALSSLSQWTIERAWLSQETLMAGSQGDPVFTGFGKPDPAYSQIDMGLILKRDALEARDFVPKGWFIHLAIVSFVGTFLAYILDRKERGQFWRLQAFFLRLIFWPVLLMSVGNMALDQAQRFLPLSMTDQVAFAIDILWWIVPARILAISLERFVWIPLENRTGRQIPGVIRAFGSATIYLFAFFGIVAFVLGKPLTSLLATTGLTAMIIGVAIQANIANIFSGIILNLERPFALGDWIRMGSVVGYVTDITWRTTKIVSWEGPLISVPNRTISEANVENLNKARVLESGVDIYLPPMLEPTAMIALIAESLVGNRHLAIDTPNDEPYIIFNGVVNQNGAWMARYKVCFFVRIVPKRSSVIDDLWLKLWPKLMAHGVQWAGWGGLNGQQPVFVALSQPVHGTTADKTP